METERKFRIVLLVVLSLLTNIFAGYFFVAIFYLLEYRMAGIDRFLNDFLPNPNQYWTGLVMGDTSNTVLEQARIWYLNPWLQLAFWGYIAFCIVRLGSSKGYKPAHTEGSHGTARFATGGEIRRLQKDQKGFILGEYRGKPVIHPLQNMCNLNSNFLVIGGSGSAKTAGYVIPNVLHVGETLGHSMILPDPKGEIFNKTSRHLKDLGYKVVTFNLLDQDKRRSDRYNPVRKLKRGGKVMTDEVLELADQIMGSTGGVGKGEHNFFAVTGRDLLVAMILYVLEARPEEEHHLRNVLHIVSTVGKDPETLRKLFGELPDSSEARAFFDNVDAPGAEKQWEGVRGEMRSRLGLWNLNSIAELTADSDFDFTQMGQEKTVLYLMIPDSSNTYNLLPTLLIDQAFKELIRLADTSPGGRLPVPTWFILDELGNLARIRELDVKVNTIRSRGIQLVGIFQSLPQFEDKYGKLGSKAISGSSDTLVFLGTRDQETNEQISKDLGVTTIKTKSLSKNSKDSFGSSESNTGRKLMTPDEVRKLRDRNQLIVVQASGAPMLLKKHLYFKQDKWKAVLEKEVDWQKVIPQRATRVLKLFDPPKFNSDKKELPEELLPL